MIITGEIKNGEFIYRVIRRRFDNVETVIAFIRNIYTGKSRSISITGNK